MNKYLFKINPVSLILLFFLAPSANAVEVVDKPLNIAAIGTFLLFTVITLFITWWAARRTHTRQEFYVAGNKIGSLFNGFAIAGDTMSAASFIGIVGLALIAGFDMLYYIICVVLSWAVVLFLIAGRLKNLGTYTFADAVSVRLSPRPMRILSSCGSLAVIVPYMIAQIVAAGTLVEVLFGLSYLQGIIIIGVLMTIYVTFGGMLATTWVQIVKAVLLLFGGTILALGVLAKFNFDIGDLARASVNIHPQGIAILQPGLLFDDFISVLSLMLAFVGGTAGMPHVLMRFFTVPGAKQARRSAAYALGLIAYFQFVIVIIGVGAIAMLVDNTPYSLGGTSLVGGNNMAAIHLSHIIGGDIFLGFISAVVFATILAVVSGLALSAAATVSHDIFANVIREGKVNNTEELFVSRLTIVVLGIVTVLLAVLFEGQNIGVLVVIPLAIGASTNFPIILLSMYWRGFTTRGAIVGGYTGLLLSITLILLGPIVWVDAFGFERPIFPYAYPTLFSMAACFLLAWYFSITDKSERARTESIAFDAQLFKSEMGELFIVKDSANWKKL